MPRAPNEKVKQAQEMYRKGMKLIEIAQLLELPAGTVRRWKNTYQWDSERSEKKANVRKEKSKGSQEKILSKSIRVQLSDGAHQRAGITRKYSDKKRDQRAEKTTNGERTFDRGRYFSTVCGHCLCGYHGFCILRPGREAFYGTAWADHGQRGGRSKT